MAMSFDGTGTRISISDDGRAVSITSWIPPSGESGWRIVDVAIKDEKAQVFIDGVLLEPEGP